jgi:hypothetical protein
MVSSVTKKRHERKDMNQAARNQIGMLIHILYLVIVWFLNISYITISEEVATSNEIEEHITSDNDYDIAEEEVQDVNFEVNDNDDFDYLSGEALIDGIFVKWGFNTNQLVDLILYYF